MYTSKKNEQRYFWSSNIGHVICRSMSKENKSILFSNYCTASLLSLSPWPLCLFSVIKYFVTYLWDVKGYRITTSICLICSRVIMQLQLPSFIFSISYAEHIFTCITRFVSKVTQNKFHCKIKHLDQFWCQRVVGKTVLPACAFLTWTHLFLSSSLCVMISSWYHYSFSPLWEK